jgi:uncharacterized RDD family membrane protein YckC
MSDLRLRLGAEVFPLDKDRVMVGRSRFCDIRLQEDTVSRLHAAFTYADGVLQLEDLGSSNGTFVNGEPLVGSCRLAAGDTVRCGALRGTIEDGSVRASGDQAGPSSDVSGRPTAGVRSPEPAGLGRRLLVVGTDATLFALGTIVPFLPLAGVLALERFLPAGDAAPASLQTKIAIGAGCCVLWLVYAWYFFIHSWARRGGSPGMRAWGVWLVDWRYRGPIGYSRAWLRAVAVLVTLLSLGTGFLTLLFRRDRRALHDLLAGTLVVRGRSQLGASPPPA